MSDETVVTARATSIQIIRLDEQIPEVAVDLELELSDLRQRFYTTVVLDEQVDNVLDKMTVDDLVKCALTKAGFNPSD